MLVNLINKYKNSKEFLVYFVLTYLDKVISFALPLSILFLIKDKSLYAFVEVAFSYATIAMIIIELGVSNYLFYGYKQSPDKEKFVLDAQFFFKFLLFCYCILAICILLITNFLNSGVILIFLMVSIRTLFMLYLNFYSTIYRLKDNPSGIYLISILINVVSFVLLMLANVFSWKHAVFYFFIPSLLMLAYTVLRFTVLEFRMVDISKFKQFLINSIRFSWPIILNVLAMNYMNNYAKIYAFGNLMEHEMVQISYIMRIGLIIQLTHSAFSSFYSKSLFMDSSQKFNTKIFKRYNLILLLSMVFVGLIISSTNYFFGYQIRIPITISTLLFLIYIVLWCYIGYLEIYFGIMNANRKILYYSIFSSIVYTLLLKFSTNVSVFQLSLFMVITVFLNLVLVVFGLFRLKVFTFKSGIK